MLGAEGRRIVDNMLEVSPGHIRHWEMQGKNEDTTEEVWEGSSPIVMSPVHFWRTRSAKGRGRRRRS
jgi:hypothetical protein